MVGHVLRLRNGDRSPIMMDPAHQCVVFDPDPQDSFAGPCLNCGGDLMAGRTRRSARLKDPWLGPRPRTYVRAFTRW